MDPVAVFLKNNTINKHRSFFELIQPTAFQKMFSFSAVSVQIHIQHKYTNVYRREYRLDMNSSVTSATGKRNVCALFAPAREKWVNDGTFTTSKMLLRLRHTLHDSRVYEEMHLQAL
jgi:hypothetical protein